MEDYSIDIVSARIEELECNTYPRLCPHVVVENIRIEEDYVLADIRLSFEGQIEELIRDCQYPDRLFYDCIKKKKEDASSYSMLAIATRYESIINKLSIAKTNEEGTTLDDIQKHIHRISSYYKWMLHPEGVQDSQFYAKQLSFHLDSADVYLIQLYNKKGGTNK